ncbi:MAG: succinate dehydrogenase assembly factor 2 [Rhodobacterales bacterium]|nr:MAG: succinate dehydrogenase assembly factor 2 [Rhodobacterales bacterium]
MSETPENRLKRLSMRSHRRGTREMDLILGRYADACLAGLTGAALDDYESLLEENDHDLYLWVSGRAVPPDRYAALVARIASHTGKSARR